MANDATTPTPDAHDDTGHAHVNYLIIFVALCICTLLSVVFDLIDLNKRVVAVLVLAVAVAKAQFVMRYFMHLKFEGLWKYVLLLPTVILAMGLPMALAPDIALHYYRPETQAAVAAEIVDLDGAEAVPAGNH